MRWYAVAVYAISLTLLLTTTLASAQLVGSDIHLEYFYAQQALDGWDPSLPHSINGALSVTLLAPFLSRLLHIDLMWVFKLAFPMLFALVPVILFSLYQRVLTDRQAFLAALFFVAVPMFTLELTGLARQQIAEVFLALLLHGVVVRWHPLVLLLCALMALLSHYTVGMLAVAFLAVVLVLYGLRRQWRQGGRLALGLLLVGAFASWYFNWVADGWIATHIGNVLSGAPIGTPAAGAPGAIPVPPSPGFFDGNARGQVFRAAVGLDFVEVDLWSKLFRGVQWVTEGLVGLGAILLLRAKNIPVSYRALLAAALLLLLAALAIPRVGALLNITRWYHLALMVTAPAFVYAGLRALKREWAVAALLAVYFVFTSGLVFHLVGTYDLSRITVPYSIALSNESHDAGGYLTEDDDVVARWIAENITVPVYADVNGVMKVQDHVDMWHVWPLDGRDAPLPEGAYVFLRSWNVEKGTLAYWAGPGLRRHEPNWVTGDVVFQHGSAKVVRVK